MADQAVSFLIEKHFLLPDLWAKFVDQYRIRQESDGGWRGEFWEKMMRGGVLLYQYRKDERFFAVLTEGREKDSTPIISLNLLLNGKQSITINDIKIDIAVETGYPVSDGFAYFKQSRNGENNIERPFDMPIKITHPIEWQEDIFYFSNFYEGIVREEKVFSAEGERDYICLTKSLIAPPLSGSLPILPLI